MNLHCLFQAGSSKLSAALALLLPIEKAAWNERIAAANPGMIYAVELQVVRHSPVVILIPTVRPFADSFVFSR
jgi:hypothetical protein